MSAEPGSVQERTATRPGAVVTPHDRAAVTRRVLAAIDAWTDGRARAVWLAGSHAAGHAVWRAASAGRIVPLSDLDLYVIVPDRAVQARARRRMRDHVGALDLGAFASAIEVAFLTPADAAALPRRPGVFELAAHGVRLAGAGERPRASGVGHAASDEEQALLLENRAFELLLAYPPLAHDDPATRPRLAAWHAVMKCRLELAAARCLAHAMWPATPAERVAFAVGERAPGAPDAAFFAPALAWLAGEADVPDAAEARRAWRATVVAWVTAWRARQGPGDDRARIAAAARRAPLRRRVRQWLAPATAGFRAGAAPPLAVRASGLWQGAALHRLNAAAAALLIAAADAAGEPRLTPALARSVADLGVLPARACASWTTAAAALARRWDDWALDGRRVPRAAGAAAPAAGARA